jgi:hypothetical protein
VVLADSRQLSRFRRYLGTLNRGSSLFAYGALTHCGAPFQDASAKCELCNSVMDLVPHLSGPATPYWQRHQAVTPVRFRLIPFRSPLLRESRVVFFSSGYLDVSVHPVPSTGPMCSGRSNTPLRVLGFPIRTSTDQSLVGGSPWLFAATHVLHR